MKSPKWRIKVVVESGGPKTEHPLKVPQKITPGQIISHLIDKKKAIPLDTETSLYVQINKLNASKALEDFRIENNAIILVRASALSDQIEDDIEDDDVDDDISENE